MRRPSRIELLARILGALALHALAGWWVLVPHSFDGAIVVEVTEYHGVHATDWPALVFGVVGCLLVHGGRTRRRSSSRL